MKYKSLFVAVAMAACAAPPVEKSDEPAVTPLELGGTRWVMQDSDAAAGAQMPTIEFSAANRANGFSGCNQWFAQTDTANGGLRFAAVGMTRRACPEPAMTTEREFGAMLERTRAAQLEGADLVLFGDEAEEIGRFSPRT